MTRATRSRGTRACVAGAVALGMGLAAAPADAARTVVQRGASIQAAIDRASDGDTIVVRPGRYRESLQISKDRIRLRGRAATLLEPRRAAPTLCNEMGATTGVCVVGEVRGGDDGPPEVVQPVRGVRITGLRVRGFEGDGIFAYGAADLRVTNNRLIRNGGYGLFSLNSTGTRAVGNVAGRNGEAGLYFGGSQEAQVVARRNRTTNNRAPGIFIRDASTGSVRDNVISGNCVGILMLAGAPGPVTRWSISENRVLANNRACAGADGEPPQSGAGIALIGAAETEVSDNRVIGHMADGPSAFSGGIVVMTPPIPGAEAPSMDLIVDNRATGNQAADLVWDGTGPDIVFRGNACTASQPAGLCG